MRSSNAARSPSWSSTAIGMTTVGWVKGLPTAKGRIILSTVSPMMSRSVVGPTSGRYMYGPGPTP